MIARIDGAFARLNQLSGKAGAALTAQRMADEHPQPHQHSRRHLRVRPAGLLRLAAARRRRGGAPTCCSGSAR